MNDINKYDYLSVSVKIDSEAEMVTRYGVFGWELIERLDDKRFSNIALINFRRLHTILNKDRLQYLQVNMETAVNNFAKYKQNKHAFSLALGLSLGVFGCALLIGGIALIVLLTLWSIIIGCLMTLCAVVVFVGMSIALRIILPKENLRYDIVRDTIQKELSLIEKEATELVGKNHG